MAARLGRMAVLAALLAACASQPTSQEAASAAPATVPAAGPAAALAPAPAAPAAAAPATAAAPPPARPISICAYPAPAAAKCGAALGAGFVCVPGASAADCIEKVATGAADMVKLLGDEMYTAHTTRGLMPVASEYYGTSVGTSYFSLAVVTKEFCDSFGTRGPTLADLKGRRSCHTGYRKTAGWTVPVGLLVAKGIMPVVNTDPAVQADAQSVAAFFSQTCAPRTTADGPRRGGAQWEGLCTACNGDCKEPGAYADYPGALRCLMEGNGDVAWTKETTVRDYVRGGAKAQPWSTADASQLRLLCPAGGCAPVDKFDSCNVARVPAYALMATPAFKSSEAGRRAAAALAAAGRDPAFIARGVDAGIFTKDTKDIKVVDVPFDEYFGASTMDAFASMRRLQAAAPPPAGAPGGGAQLSPGAVAGIVIGALAAVALALAAGVCVARRRRAARAAARYEAYQREIAVTGKGLEP